MNFWERNIALLRNYFFTIYYIFMVMLGTNTAASQPDISG